MWGWGGILPTDGSAIFCNNGRPKRRHWLTPCWYTHQSLPSHQQELDSRRFGCSSSVTHHQSGLLRISKVSWSYLFYQGSESSWPHQDQHFIPLSCLSHQGHWPFLIAPWRLVNNRHPVINENIKHPPFYVIKGRCAVALRMTAVLQWKATTALLRIIFWIVIYLNVQLAICRKHRYSGPGHLGWRDTEIRDSPITTLSGTWWVM